MDHVNSGADMRVSSWTLATGTQPGRRQARVAPNRSGRRTVALISSQPHPSHVLEAIMKGGEYDIVLVELTAHAYSRIRRVTPDLVVLCLPIDDLNAFHVLSMLKLDSATSSIPVVTYEMICERTPAVPMN